MSTQIEWVKNPDNTTQGITVNSKTGCRNHTPEGLCLGGLFPCYAWKLAQGRLKQRYLANRDYITWRNTPIDFYDDKEGGGQFYKAEIDAPFDPFYPRWWPERLEQIRKIKKPTGIFLDDMSDWMGDCWPKEYTEAELQMMRDNPQHRIYTLTKQPQNLIKWSFPDNCWVGVTATNTEMFMQACSRLEYPVQAKLKYISLEPLLQWSFNWEQSYLVNALKRADIGWLIIGQQTPVSRKTEPKIEWIQEIVDAVDKAGVRVFLKDNLNPLIHRDVISGQYALDTGLLNWAGELRQEMPAIRQENG